MPPRMDSYDRSVSGAQKLEQLRSVTSILLDSQRPVHSLRPEVVEIKTILADSQTMYSAPPEDIAGGETRTSNGLALSPKMAAMCIDDFVRMIEFIRGTYAAIIDIRERFPDRPARVLHVGCGPYATLLVPLMATFSSTEERSSRSLMCILNRLRPPNPLSRLLAFPNPRRVSKRWMQLHIAFVLISPPMSSSSR